MHAKEKKDLLNCLVDVGQCNWKDDDGTILLCGCESKECFCLNEAGSFAWKLFSAGRTIGNAVDELTGKFKAARSRIQKDILELVLGLEEQGLVRIFTVQDSSEESPLLDYLNKYGQNWDVKEYHRSGSMRVTPKKKSKDGRIDMSQQLVFFGHWSGWGWVLQHLERYHSPKRALFDGFLENSFFTPNDSKLVNWAVPYQKDWCGVVHYPLDMPGWIAPGRNSHALINSPQFQESLLRCKGLFTFSKANADLMKKRLPGTRISALYHPADDKGKKFSKDSFLKSRKRRIINLGWWLRKYGSFFRLDVDSAKYDKCRVEVFWKNPHELRAIKMKEAERGELGTRVQQRSVEIIPYLSRDEYDKALANSIVFLDLYAACANNVVVECIARGTPILVNRLPSTIEYLGQDYPFFFDSLDEASEKLDDDRVIIETHRYIVKSGIQKRVRMSTFLRDFKNSSVYRNLPASHVSERL